MPTDNNEKVRQYFDIKLATLDFIIKHHADFTTTTRPESYFADLAFFAEFFGLNHDEKFVRLAREFCKVYNRNIENYDIDIYNEEE